MSDNNQETKIEMESQVSLDDTGKDGVDAAVEEAVAAKTTKEKPTVYQKNARKRRHTPGPAKKKKRITSVEKMRVLELSIEGKTIAEMATALDRTVPTITKIVNELKEKTKQAFGDEIAVGFSEDMVSTMNFAESPAFSRIVNRLVAEGLDAEIARARVVKVFVAAQNKNIDQVSEEEVYVASQSTVSGKEIFSRKSEKGKTSVITTNTAASERGDDLLKSKKTSAIQDHIDNQRLFRVN